jgi:hypothetical protein
VSLALDEAEGILRVQVPPDDRAYQAVLRAKTAILNGALTNQVRVDEVKFKAGEDKDKMGKLLEELRAFQRDLEEKQAVEDKADAKRARGETAIAMTASATSSRPKSTARKPVRGARNQIVPRTAISLQAEPESVSAVR